MAPPTYEETAHIRREQELAVSRLHLVRESDMELHNVSEFENDDIVESQGRIDDAANHRSH